MTPPSQPESAGIRFPPPFIYALGWLVGWEIGHLWPLALIPAGVAWRLAAGWGLVGLGIALMATALLHFARAGTTPRPDKPAKAIVVTGPYRFTRNPMYLGFTLAYLGATVIANAVWPLPLLVVVQVVMVRVVIDREERYLEAAFGDGYRAYRARVRRWL